MSLLFLNLFVVRNVIWLLVRVIVFFFVGELFVVWGYFDFFLGL